MIDDENKQVSKRSEIAVGLYLLAAFGLLSRFRVAYFVGAMIILVGLLLEHWLARRRQLKWINAAFFKLNAVISLVFLSVVVIEVVFPSFRVRR